MRRLLGKGGVVVAVLAVISACDTPSRAPDACDDLYRSLQHGSRERYAEGNLRESLDCAEALRCHLAIAKIHNALAVFENERSRMALALDHLSTSERAVIESRSHDSSRRAERERSLLEYFRFFNTASAYFRLGKLEDVQSLWRELHRDFRTLGKDLRLEEKVDFALLSSRLHRNLDELDEAEKHLLQAEGLLEAPSVPWRTAAAWFQERGLLHATKGELELAETSLHDAIRHHEELKDPKFTAERANFYVDLAEIDLAAHRPEQALARTDRALSMTAGSTDLNLEAHLRFVRSRALAALGRMEEALETLGRAQVLLEARRDLWSDLGLEFFAQRDRYSRYRLTLALELEDVDRVYSALEERQARSLFLRLSRSDRETVIPAELEADMEAGRSRLAESLRALDQWDVSTGQEGRDRLERDFLVARGQVAMAWARMVALTKAPEPLESVGPRQAAAWLGPDTLGISFAVAEREVALVLLEPSGALSLVRTDIERRDVEEAVRSISDAGGARSAASIPGVQELGRRLLGPLAGSLEDYRRLAVVPGSLLEGLPFGAFEHPTSGSPLIVSHAVYYLPSFSVLAASRTASQACSPSLGSLLGFGDPIFGNEDPRWPRDEPSLRSANLESRYPRLEGSGREVEALFGLYSDTSLILKGQAATHERFMAEAEGFQILHLASHSYSDPSFPERSVIPLTCIQEADREKCDLYLPDLARLELCGPLVVLSACSSVGEYRLGGEGLLGLPRAFLERGAASVVATTWAIEDGAAAELMSDFHRHVSAGSDVANALRLAKLEWIKAGRPIEVWAPFVVIGDGGWRRPEG